MRKFNLKIDKKIRYLIFSVIIAVLLYLFSREIREVVNYPLAYASVIVAILGVLVVQYPYIKLRNILYYELMPVVLISGALLSFVSFPNLASPIKVLLVITLAITLYIINLVNNVFLVVEDRGELIPLYRVAATWSQILLIIVAIPFFAGIFKMPIISLVQIGIVTLFSFLFTLYITWVTSFDVESRKTKLGDRLLLSSISAFFVFAGGFGVSFFPTESFLRALFLSSVLMFGLNYVYSYIKNTLNRKQIIENLAITFVFFLLLLVYSN